jgi:hypothetical protein
VCLSFAALQGRAYATYKQTVSDGVTLAQIRLHTEKRTACSLSGLRAPSLGYQRRKTFFATTTSLQAHCSLLQQCGYKVVAQPRHTAKHNLLKLRPLSKLVTGSAPPSVHLCEEGMLLCCQLSKTNLQIYRLTAATPKREEQSKDLQTSQRPELLASSF